MTVTPEGAGVCRCDLAALADLIPDLHGTASGRPVVLTRPATSGRSPRTPFLVASTPSCRRKPKSATSSRCHRTLVIWTSQRIDVLPDDPRDLAGIVDVDVLVDHDDHFGKHQLTEAPEGVHDIRVTG